jgi:hypothetical protein
MRQQQRKSSSLFTCCLRVITACLSSLLGHWGFPQREIVTPTHRQQTSKQSTTHTYEYRADRARATKLWPSSTDAVYTYRTCVELTCKPRNRACITVVLKPTCIPPRSVNLRTSRRQFLQSFNEGNLHAPHAPKRLFVQEQCTRNHRWWYSTLATLQINILDCVNWKMSSNCII